MAENPSSLEIAESVGANAVVGKVVARNSLSRSVVEVVINVDTTVAGEPGQNVMVLIPLETKSIRRRYSVRSANHDERTITLWIEIGHDGAGSRWARDVKIGDEVDLVGPRGKIFLNKQADWHLFIGDTSSLGAFYSMASAVEPPDKVIFIVECSDATDILTAQFTEGVGVTGIFVDRQSRALDDPSGLLSALASFEIPAGDGHAYLFGEFSVNRVLETALIDRGMIEESISHKAFYRAGRQNRDHGEPEKD